MISVNRKILIGVAAGAIILLALVPSLYFYSKYKSAQSALKDPQANTEQETKNLVNAVGRLMELPSDEVPSIATVKDKTKLEDQPFFNKSQNGDKILFYAQAKKAILYRPSVNKIIDVAPINITENTPDANVTPTEKQEEKKAEIRVAIFNGTQESGLAKKTESQLKELGAEFKVVQKADAKGSSYTENTIVDLSKKNEAAAKKIQQHITGTVVATIPDAESLPDADILIILGKSE